MAEKKDLEKLDLRAELKSFISKTGEVNIPAVREAIKKHHLRLMRVHHADVRKDNLIYGAEVNDSFASLETTTESELSSLVLQYVKESDGKQGLLQQALEEIERLDGLVEHSRKDLRETQVLMMGIANGRRTFQKSDVIVYHDPRLRITITLENADRELSRLLYSGNVEKGLIARLHDAETELEQCQAQLIIYRQKAHQHDRVGREIEEIKRGQAEAMAAAERLMLQQRQELEDRIKALETQSAEAIDLKKRFVKREKRILEKVEALKKENRFEEAFNYLKTYHELFPERAAPLYKAGTIYEERGKLGMAGKCYYSVLQKQKSTLAEEGLKRVKEKIKQGLLEAKNAKNYDKALARCDTLLEINPNDSEALHMKGQIYEAQGDKIKAKECYTKVPWTDEDFRNLMELGREME